MFAIREFSLFFNINIYNNINMKNNKFSPNNNNNNNIKDNNFINRGVIPIITYVNAGIDKFRIYEENRKKSGIYRWVI